MEGGFDTAHVAFLHRNLTTNTTRPGISPKAVYLRSPTAPKLEMELTDYGYLQVNIRVLGEKENWVAINHHVMPFHMLRFTTFRGDPKRSLIEGHMWVPIDAENCMVYNWLYRHGEQPMLEEERSYFEKKEGEKTVDFRKVRNRANNWLIDRQVQRTETFTGIEDFNTQDHAIQESMGPIVDRTQEHLIETDKVTIEARRLLIQAVKTVQAGCDPPGLSSSYYRIRPTAKIVPNGVQWQDAL